MFNFTLKTQLKPLTDIKLKQNLSEQRLKVYLF